jgi:hypothetical protein
MNVLVMQVKEVVMVDVHLNLMMVMDVVYWMILSDDKEVKQRHKLNLMMVMHLHYHDDVLKKMVLQIWAYNLVWNN